MKHIASIAWVWLASFGRGLAGGPSTLPAGAEVSGVGVVDVVGLVVTDVVGDAAVDVVGLVVTDVVDDTEVDVDGVAVPEQPTITNTNASARKDMVIKALIFNLPPYDSKSTFYH